MSDTSNIFRMSSSACFMFAPRVLLRLQLVDAVVLERVVHRERRLQGVHSLSLRVHQVEQVVESLRGQRLLLLASGVPARQVALASPRQRLLLLLRIAVTRPS